MYLTHTRHEVCKPDKKTIKHVYCCDVAHYIVAGYGFYNGRRLGAGEGFVCRYGEAAEYYPDPSDPWEYYWIRMEGADNHHFFDLIKTDRGNVFSHDLSGEIKALHDLMRTFDSPLYESLKSTAFPEIAMKLHSPDAAKELSTAEKYTERVKRIIEENLCESPRIAEIAGKLHLNRCYLRNIFFECEGMSPREYRQKKRMEYAAKLLSGTPHQIGIIAGSVGYMDQMQFSREFRKVYGMSPSEYRRANEKSAE